MKLPPLFPRTEHRPWPALWLATLLAWGPAAQAQVSVGISLPGVAIGVNVPVYPRLEQVPGHPVYWSPRGEANYFFADGLYWVYREDTWYHSGWYNGPWQGAEPYDVPVAVLRVPVRYYRLPPPHFRSWQANAAPRWGERWGPSWEQRRPGWDRVDRRAARQLPPLPVYQRDYRGGRYPQAREQQEQIRRDRERGGRDRGGPSHERRDDRDHDRGNGRGPDRGGDRGGDRGRGGDDKGDNRRGNNR